MSKVLGFFSKAFGAASTAKATVESVFSTMGFLLQAKDKLKDDLDKVGEPGYGKAEIQDIWDDVGAIEDEAVDAGKKILTRLKDAFMRAKRLQAHVMEAKK